MNVLPPTTDNDFFKTIKRIKLFKLDRDDAAWRVHNPEQGRLVRLYKSFADTWSLQIFGPLGIGPLGRRDGKDFVIATAELNRDDLIAIRNAITAFLKQS